MSGLHDDSVCRDELWQEDPGFGSGDGDEMVLVQLRPFPHQAGGHTAVLELSRSTICKPYDDREAWFYRHEPNTLKEFTPKYLGETEVTCSMCHDRLHLTAAVPRTLANQRGLSEVNSREVSSNSISPKSSLNRRRSRKRCFKPEVAITKSDVTSCLEGWSIKCIERQIDRYGFWANNRPQKFIMLENLVHTYRKPCLMDLKMGRRQFGDDSSLEKKRLLVERCAQSTSATLGFRISGSQVYQSSTAQYCVRDKYVGRDLDNQGAVNEIRHFFYNGLSVRTDAIDHVIEKLERLKSALIECATLNFYSCSLLLMYEGLVTSLDHHGDDTDAPDCVRDTAHQSGDVLEEVTKDEDKTAKVDVRLIDFAHVNEKKEFDDEDTEGVERNDYEVSVTKDSSHDDTIIFGIEQLLQVLAELRDQ